MMNKRLVSILISGVLFISNVGVTSFALEKNSQLTDSEAPYEEEDDSASDSSSETSENDTNEYYSEEEREYYKISGFTELPEYIVNQKLKVGGSLDELEFPDTIEIMVVSDTDRDERIERNLGAERERIGRERENAAKEASSEASSGSSDASDDASSAVSLDEDVEEIIFFESDSEDAQDNASSESESEDYYEESNESNLTESTTSTDSSVNEATIVDNTSSNSGDSVDGNSAYSSTDASESDTVEQTDENSESENTDSVESTESESSEEAAEQESTTEDLIGKISSVFKKLVVYAADENTVTDNDEEDSAQTDDSDETETGSASDDQADDSEESADTEESYSVESSDEEVSIERVSQIQWVLDYEACGYDEFSSEEVGREYVFVPILIIPDTYYIEADRPTITVEIVEENFVFDEAVEIDGVKVRVRAEKNVFPEGVSLAVEKLSSDDEEKVEEAFSEQTEVENIAKSYTFDIRILDRDGNEVEPDTDRGKVVVSFETEEVENEKLTPEIYHITETEAVEEANAEDEGEKAADSDKEDTEGEENTDGESKESIYSDDVVLKVEKLEASVVESDEAKVVEAETDGFSTYKVVFTCSNYGSYELEDSNIVSIKEILAKTGVVTVDDNSDDVIDEDDVTGTIGGVDIGTNVDYLYTTQLTGDPSEYSSLLVNEDATGLYTGTSGDHYLVIKRPFIGTKTITITYDSTDYPVTLSNNKAVSSLVWENERYPYALDMGEKTFCLEAPAYNMNGDPVLYQWQKSADGVTWEDADTSDGIKYSTVDIDGANCEFYLGTKDTTDSVNYWYRCEVNGKYSNAVQIITPGSDTSRTWTGYYGSTDQCYVSNGTMAYTLDSDESEFDIVGEFTSNSVKYMYQTTNGGDGWKFTCDATSTASYQALDCLSAFMMGFDEDESTLIHITAELDIENGYNYFAICGYSQIGDTSQNTGIATITSTSSSTSSYSYLTSVGILGTATYNTAQSAVNKGTGDTIPSLKITPSEENIKSADFYMSKSGSLKPYGKTTATSSKTKTVDEAIPRLSLSWQNVSSTSTKEDICIDFSFAGVTTNGILSAVSKTANVTNYSGSSNIKSVKYTGSELASYAKTLGEPSDTVVVSMKLGSSSSSSAKTAISSELPTYTRSTSTSTTTSTSSSSTSTSTTKYSVDYFDTTITKKIASESATEVTELSSSYTLTLEISYDFDSKDDIRVYRYHGSSASELSSGSGSDGTYKIDKDNGKIYIYARKFSTFAVAYKPITYYTVTFDNGTTTSSVKVVSGAKVSQPDTPTKDGYTFKGWYTDKTGSTLYNFDTAVTKSFTLYAGWTSNTAATATTNTTEDGAVNGVRAPQTSDSMPIVWLWVIILAVSTGVLGYEFVERFGSKSEKIRRIHKKIKRFLLLVGIIVSTTVKFFAKKLQQKKHEAFLVGSAALIILAIVVLATTLVQYRRSEVIYEEAEDVYVFESLEDSSTESVKEDIEIPADEFNWWEAAQINVEQISEEYPEVVGWIYFENEDISYPIMFSGDNSKYLSTAYTGEKTKAGAIFIDGESTPDFSDPHSLIYGHNMRDLSMFGKLRYYKTNPEYYEDHQYFQIFTANGIYRYQIFAYEEVSDSHDVFWVFGKEPEGFWDMLQEIEEGSYADTGIEANASDHVITLATCTSAEDQRFIVSALRTDEYVKNQ